MRTCPPGPKLLTTLCGVALAGLAGAQTAPPPPRDEFYWLGQINKASLVINTEQGLLDKTLAPRIAAGLQQVLQAGDQPGAKRPSSVISFEPLLIAAAGPEVTWLHAGRSSQDMHATFRAAILREDLLGLAEQLHGTTTTLVGLAERHAATVVPNYTNGVAAQPNSLGHQLLGHVAGLARDAQRLQEAYARLDRSAMGSTVLNGSSWPLDRPRMAAALGFAATADNAYDAGQIASMEHPVEVGGLVTSVALHAGHFVEDVLTQYAQPRPWILLQEGGANTYVSSAMPQKRNPGLLNNTRRDASAALALAHGVVLQAHNITPGMADPKEVRANRAVVASAVTVLKQWQQVLQALVIDPQRALEELNSDWTASQEVADLLMREHRLPFRIGHHVASEMVDLARARGYKPTDFPYAEAQRLYAEAVKGTPWPAQLPISEAALRAALDPVAIVRNRATAGGPQPAEMARMLAAARQTLAEQARWTQARRAAIRTAAERLEASFTPWLGKP